MRKTLAMSLATVFAASAMASPSDLSTLSKDLNIMETVLNTSLTQAVKELRMKVRNVDATYLKDQGVMFTIKTGRGGFFDHQFLDKVTTGLGLDSPEAVRDFVFAEKEFDLRDELPDLDIDIEVDDEEPRPLRERLRELRLEQRDVGYERRELVRRKRDIEFELKRADDLRKKELEGELSLLDKDLERLNASKQELDTKAAQIREEKARMHQEKQAQRDAVRTRFLSSVESSLVDTFCRYGSGLNALDSDEKVNVVIEGFGEAQAAGDSQRSDRIYVFSVKDIKSCVSGKAKPESLLDKASVYSF